MHALFRAVLFAPLFALLVAPGLARGAAPDPSLPAWAGDDLAPPQAVFDRAVELLLEGHPAPTRLLGRAGFEARVARIRGELGSESSDTALAVAILRVVHLVADGHTSLQIDGSPPADAVFPARFLCQAEELRVAAVLDLDRRVLGGRVLELLGTPIDEVRRRVLPLCTGDNEFFAWTISAPQMLKYPRIASELGLADADGRSTLLVECLDGERRLLELDAVAPDAGDWTELEYPDATQQGLFLTRRDAPHWVRSVPEAGIVYAQYNHVNNGEPTTEAFAEDLVAALEASGVERLVVDVRRNGGGNNFRNPPILHAILKNETINRPGHLFVLTSPKTYSACVNFCGWLERETHAIFVGEPTGAPPNMYGDVESHPLGRDGWTLHVSAWYWQESMPWDQRLFIQPHVQARATLPDLLAGRDPVLEAAVDFDDPRLVESLAASPPRTHYEHPSQQPAVDARPHWPTR